MEVDDDENEKSAVAIQIDVFKTLIGCLGASSLAKIELVFKTITNNLTYDDPGMFMKMLIRDERVRQIQDATVMWLLNQVIALTNKHGLYR